VESDKVGISNCDYMDLANYCTLSLSTHQEGCSLLDPPSHAFLGEVLCAVIIPEDVDERCVGRSSQSWSVVIAYDN
jgi:hypothetical protein